MTGNVRPSIVGANVLRRIVMQRFSHERWWGDQSQARVVASGVIVIGSLRQQRRRICALKPRPRCIYSLPNSIRNLEIPRNIGIVHGEKHTLAAPQQAEWRRGAPGSSRFR